MVAAGKIAGSTEAHTSEDHDEQTTQGRSGEQSRCSVQKAWSSSKGSRKSQKASSGSTNWHRLQSWDDPGVEEAIFDPKLLHRQVGTRVKREISIESRNSVQWRWISERNW